MSGGREIAVIVFCAFAIVMMVTGALVLLLDGPDLPSLPAMWVESLGKLS